MVTEYGLPVAKSCRCVGLSRSYYCVVDDHWTVSDAEVIAALAGLVEGRPRRGFWKCYKMLQREVHSLDHKRVYRVYKLMNLHLRRPAKKRLPKRHRIDLYVSRLADTVWSADLMSDSLINGRRFSAFNVVDDFDREALHIEIDTSITSQRLVRVFERIRRESTTTGAEDGQRTTCAVNLFFVESPPSARL